jgi:1-acyl-sn-glycerol-3-phosphate acyltransferase
VAIFPEATIPPNAPVLGPFKNGTFRLAVESGVPIVPVTWKDNYKRLGDPGVWCSNGSPGVARVVIHPPVQPGNNEKGDFIDLRQKVFRSIDSELPAPYQTHTDHGN